MEAKRQCSLASILKSRTIIVPAARLVLLTPDLCHRTIFKRMARRYRWTDAINNWSRPMKDRLTCF